MQIADAQIIPSRFFPSFSDFARSSVFFDVDGTLLDIKPSPQDVVADVGLKALILHLIAKLDGALALISGRSIADVDRIFRPLLLPTAGLHGAEIRLPNGSHRYADSKAMDHARPSVHRFVADNPGLVLEDKGATLAVHYRMRPELASHVLSFMSSFAPADDIAIQEGKFVVELKPALYDKSTAIAEFCAIPPFIGRTPIFIGDDLTDEVGFAYVNAHGGASLRIGYPEVSTLAHYLLPDPEHLRVFMAGLLDFDGDEDVRP